MPRIVLTFILSIMFITDISASVTKLQETYTYDFRPRHKNQIWIQDRVELLNNLEAQPLDMLQHVTCDALLFVFDTRLAYYQDILLRSGNDNIPVPLFQRHLTVTAQSRSKGQISELFDLGTTTFDRPTEDQRRLKNFFMENDFASSDLIYWIRRCVELSTMDALVFQQYVLADIKFEDFNCEADDISDTLEQMKTYVQPALIVLKDFANEGFTKRFKGWRKYFHRTGDLTSREEKALSFDFQYGFQRKPMLLLVRQFIDKPWDRISVLSEYYRLMFVVHTAMTNCPTLRDELDYPQFIRFLKEKQASHFKELSAVPANKSPMELLNEITLFFEKFDSCPELVVQDTFVDLMIRLLDFKEELFKQSVGTWTKNPIPEQLLERGVRMRLNAPPSPPDSSWHNLSPLTLQKAHIFKYITDNNITKYDLLPYIKEYLLLIGMEMSLNLSMTMERHSTMFMERCTSVEIWSALAKVYPTLQKAVTCCIDSISHFPEFQVVLEAYDRVPRPAAEPIRPWSHLQLDLVSGLDVSDPDKLTLIDDEWKKIFGTFLFERACLLSNYAARSDPTFKSVINFVHVVAPTLDAKGSVKNIKTSAEALSTRTQVVVQHRAPPAPTPKKDRLKEKLEQRKAKKELAEAKPATAGVPETKATVVAPAPETGPAPLASVAESDDALALEDKLKEVNKQTMLQLKAITDEKKKLEQANSQDQNIIKDLRSANTALKKRVKESEKLAEKTSREASNYIAQSEKHQTELNKIRQAVLALEASRVKDRVMMEEVNAQNAALLQQLAASQNENSGHGGVVQDLEAQKASLMDELNQATQALVKSQQQVKAFQVDHSKLKQQHEAMMQKARVGSQNLNLAIQRSDESQKELGAVQARLADSEKALAAQNELAARREKELSDEIEGLKEKRNTYKKAADKFYDIHLRQLDEIAALKAAAAQENATFDMQIVEANDVSQALYAGKWAALNEVAALRAQLVAQQQQLAQQQPVQLQPVQQEPNVEDADLRRKYEKSKGKEEQARATISTLNLTIKMMQEKMAQMSCEKK
jgi:hypothetical protein